MASYVIEGGRKLTGEVDISGSKNASLPIIAATLLNKGITKLYNVPNIHDVQIMLKILKVLGCKIKKSSGKIVIDSRKINKKEIPEELLEGYAEVVERKSVDKEEFKDYGYRWSYGKGQTVKTFKMSEEDKSAVAKTIGEQGTKSEYQYRTAESFLNSIKQNNQTNDVDLSKYQVGQRVYHKKFGEGTITKLEQEGNDVKVDLEFDKAGHKRLMAKFAGLEIIG